MNVDSGFLRTGNKTHRVILTFDDGPSVETTPKLLDILAVNEIKVIFFVVGKMMKSKAGRAIIERAFHEGHIIGNHTFSHRNLKKLSDQEVRDEILRTHNLICDITGYCNIFRPPYGATNCLVRVILGEFGYRQIFWDIDTLDWRIKSKEHWVNYVIKQIEARKNCTVLMHDIHSSTVNNLPLLFENMDRTENFCFVCDWSLANRNRQGRELLETRFFFHLCRILLTLKRSTSLKFY